VQQANAVYEKHTYIVPSQGEADSLKQDGYGQKVKGEHYSLDPCEVLYLVEKERLAVIDEVEKRILSFQEILSSALKKDALIWTKYIIYRDIRGRGFVAKTSEEIGTCFSVYERGMYNKKPPRYELFMVSEGMPETVGHLKEMLIAIMNLDRELKLAVIDRRGEVVYYCLDKFEPKNLGTDEIE
jgi:tRNA-intron endonuclease